MDTDRLSRPSLVSRIGWLALGQSAERCAQIAIVVLLARVLHSAEWNSLAMALTVYVVGVTVMSFNLEHSIVFFVPKLDGEVADALVSRTFYSLVGFGLFGAAVLQMARGFLVPGATATQSLLLAATFVMEPATAIGGALFLVKGREKMAGIWDVTMSTVQFVCVAVPAVSGMGVTGVLAGLAATSLVRFIAFLIVFRPAPMAMLNGQHRLFRSQLIFCLPVGLTLVAGTIAKSIDKWLVAVHSPTHIGVYAVAVQELPLLAVLPYAGGASIAVNLVELFGAGRTSDAHAVWWKQVETMCRWIVPATFLLVVLAPFVIPLIFGRDFREAVIPFQIFTLISVHRVTEYGAVLRAADRAMETAGSGLVLLVANLSLGWIGLRTAGIIGLTVGSVSGFIVAWLWTLRRVARVFELRVLEVFPWRTWCTHIAISAACCGAGFVLSRPVIDEASRSFTRILVFLLCLWGLTRFTSTPHRHMNERGIET